MNALEVLKKGRELISDPNKWCQGAYAQNEFGMSIDYPQASEAVKWCSVGAITKVTAMFDGEISPVGIMALTKLEDYCFEETSCSSMAGYNDNHSHAQVLEVWDTVIAKEEALMAEYARVLKEYWDDLPGEHEEERECELA